VVETSDQAVRYVFTDGGAGSVMVRYNGDDRRVAWLQSEVAYLPFIAAPDAVDPANDPPGKVLILGAGAGKDVLMAIAGADRSRRSRSTTLKGLTRDPATITAGVRSPGVKR
jgi:hypothetical protein